MRHFLPAAQKQMDALVEQGLAIEDSVTDLLENKVVLIKPAGGETAVTGFENITEAANLALAGEDVPVASMPGRFSLIWGFSGR